MGGARFGSARGVTAVDDRGLAGAVGADDREQLAVIDAKTDIAERAYAAEAHLRRYRPTEGQLFYRGQDITALNPNARPRLGIGRTFQNLALFSHMSVLGTITVGRHHLLKNNFITGSLY